MLAFFHTYNLEVWWVAALICICITELVTVGIILTSRDWVARREYDEALQVTLIRKANSEIDPIFRRKHPKLGHKPGAIVYKGW